MGTACHRRTTCRLCGSSHLSEVLSLAPTPPANAFVAEDQLDKIQPTFPLDVFFCEDCHHVQLLDVVNPAVLFENYVYVSGTSPVFVNHFEDYAAFVIDTYAPQPGALIFDIGSNDGTLLKAFKKAGYQVLGVDPAKDIAARASAEGIETIAGFFSPAMARDVRTAHGGASVITANNVFAHIDDLGGVLNGIAALLADDGVFVFEVSYLLDVFEHTLFDTIYHEHLAYHTVAPLVSFMAAHGMELIGAERVSTHGGSLRAVAQQTGGGKSVAPSVAQLIDLEKKMGLDKAETYRDFGLRIDVLKAELSTLLRASKDAGRTIAAFGAPAKATTLMYHFDIGADLIDFIVDDSPLKQGLYSPGMHIPVVPSSAIEEHKPDDIVILAWNFATPIMAKLDSFKASGGRFIVPLPSLETH
ncbi:MAG: class I SAM-dependent methyltransferase [Rhodospirillaceae bacterium]|jgi:SAM-dependent methyltransferase|nr:class I SAM-dependent methyltransferase [Rhodospirillaceae bacterium]MBT5242859.1 class I SAM-dependent methyltransferase [Rhodospirillaceae bacterium]MBT5563083.1 class I SAM-dependent methyltransferase [Rhodospirillaceae bacterium]MBT6243398.1 class I SAM-dependent methyltransferase [Rhodospirillaceae bacterium]